LHDFDETLAARAVGTISYSTLNARLARYWLSQWKDGEPPARRAINPARVKDLLPGIAILEVEPAGTVICRLAGSAIAMGLGIDPTGREVMALTPAEHRGGRFARYRRVVDGAISRSVKRLTNRFNEIVMVEDMQLPLGGVVEGGGRQILYHADWRPQTMDRSAGEILNGFDTAVDEAISIARIEPRRAAAG
jgi:hypothetical protein